MTEHTKVSPKIFKGNIMRLYQKYVYTLGTVLILFNCKFINKSYKTRKKPLKFFAVCGILSRLC